MNDHVGSGWITPLFQAVFSGLLFGLAGFCSSWPIVELDRAALYALIFGIAGSVFTWTGGALARLALAYWGRSNQEPAKLRVTRLIDPRRNGAALDWQQRQGRLKP